MSARKAFRYALELDGVNQFMIQEITPPSAEVAEIPHGAPGNLPDVKTAGKVKFGDLVLKMIKPEITADTFAWEMLADAIAGLEPSYKKIGFLKSLDTTATTTVESFFIGECWVKKIVPGGFKSQGDGENLIDEITLSVRYFYPTSSPKFTALFAAAGARAGGLPFSLGQNI